MIYLILTPGRTGSHYLKDIVRCYLLSQHPVPPGLFSTSSSYESSDFSKDNNYIIHSHNKDSIDLLKDHRSDIVLILSKRRNIFETVMSNEIAKKTREYLTYDNKILKDFDPFKVDMTVYIESFLSFSLWFDDIDLTSNYHSVKEIYYEDMIEYGIDHVGNVLGFSAADRKTRRLPQKVPYNYKDLVINWKELYSLNDRLIDLSKEVCKINKIYSSSNT